MIFFFFQNEWCSGYYKFYHKGLQYDVSISSQNKKNDVSISNYNTQKIQKVHKKFVYYLVHVILIIFITTSICKVLYSNF